MQYKFEVRVISSCEAIVEASSEAEARKKAEELSNWLNRDSIDDIWQEHDIQDLIEKGKDIMSEGEKIEAAKAASQ